MVASSPKTKVRALYTNQLSYFADRLPLTCLPSIRGMPAPDPICFKRLTIHCRKYEMKPQSLVLESSTPLCKWYYVSRMYAWSPANTPGWEISLIVKDHGVHDQNLIGRSRPEPRPAEHITAKINETQTIANEHLSQYPLTWLTNLSAFQSSCLIRFDLRCWSAMSVLLVPDGNLSAWQFNRVVFYLPWKRLCRNPADLRVNPQRNIIGTTRWLFVAVVGQVLGLKI